MLARSVYSSSALGVFLKLSADSPPLSPAVELYGGAFGDALDLEATH